MCTRVKVQKRGTEALESRQISTHSASKTTVPEGHMFVDVPGTVGPTAGGLYIQTEHHKLGLVLCYNYVSCLTQFWNFCLCLRT